MLPTKLSQRVAPPESLRRRFELANTQVNVASRAYNLLRPRSVDELISEEDFAINERIPYWADCWPSARVLAERVAVERGQRRRALELGCGIGLVSLVAAQVGFRVLATDYYADALEFTLANAKRNALHHIDTRLVDWRKLPSDLGTFDLVIASDVLYEAWQPGRIAAILASALTKDGRGLVSDPGRRAAEGFVGQCVAVGLSATCVDRVPTEDSGTRLAVSIFEIRRA